MKFKVKRLVELEVSAVKLVLPVDYDEEDIPNNFPGRLNNVWTAIIDLDTGKLRDWPTEGEFVDFDFYMKVTDSGTYSLLDSAGSVIATIAEDYVPHGVVPGEYGDYVQLDIKGGVVKNMPRRKSITAFFRDPNDD